MSQPSVEVVIPHTAGPERLARLLADLGRQTIKHSVCVADNAAPERSVGLAREAGTRVVSMGENAGFARAVNAAVKSSEADLVVLLNDDCRPESRFVEELVAGQAENGAAMVAGVLLAPSGRIDTAGVDADQSLIAYEFMRDAEYEPDRPPPRQPLGPTGGAAAFERAAFLAAGGYDERFFAYLEDLDLALRMRAAGHECALAWRACATHEHSGTLGSGSAAKNRLMGESRGRLVAKWRPALPIAARMRGTVIEGATYAGKVLADRNLAVVRGRLAARAERGVDVGREALRDVPLLRLSVREALAKRLAHRRR